MVRFGLFSLLLLACACAPSSQEDAAPNDSTDSSVEPGEDAAVSPHDAGVFEDAAVVAGSGGGGSGGSAGSTAGTGGKAGSGGAGGSVAGSGGSVAGAGGGSAGAAGGPQPECTAGALSCDDLDVLKCSASGTWQISQTCPYVCDDGVCSGSCVPGAKQCTGLAAQTCNEQGEWVTDQSCPYVCAGGSCAGSCVPGATKCGGSTVQTCDQSGVWKNAASACQYVCQAGACTGSCVPGSKQCTGLGAETCAPNGMWQPTQTCPYVCNGGSCQGSCTPGARQCNGTSAQQCNTSGQWVTDQTCPYVCSGAGSCSGECVPGSMQCSGLGAQTCDANGYWQTTSTCQYLCSAGSCTGVCTPGAQRCSGTGIQTCGSNAQWQTAVACPSKANAAATCNAGQCVFSCNTNFADCNGNAADGCEVNVSSDSNNCSACGRECCGDGVCSAGTCQPAAVVPGDWTRFDMDASYYYTVSSSDPATIKKTPKTGGATTTFLSASETKGEVRQLLADGSNLYWTSYEQSLGSTNIHSIPSGGGTIADVYSPRADVYHMELSGQDLLWSFNGPYGMWWKSRTSSAQGWTNRNANTPYWMASDGQYLYYIETATGVSCSGNSNSSTLKRVPVHGGTEVLVDSGCGSMSSLTMDGTNLYYTRKGNGTFGGLWSIPLWTIGNGGTPVKLGTGAGSTQSDGTNLFYCAGPLAKRTVGGGAEVPLTDNSGLGVCISDVKLDGQCVVYRSYDGIVTANKTR